jgi:hypothetical protein
MNALNNRLDARKKARRDHAPAIPASNWDSKKPKNIPMFKVFPAAG